MPSPAAQSKSAAMHVRDIMTRDPIAVAPSETVREIARIMLDNEISGLPVIDGQERVIGVVSRADLLLRFFEGPRGSVPTSFLESIAEGLDIGTDLDPEQLGFAEEFMSPEPFTVSPDEPIVKVARLMAEEHIHRVIVVDEDQHLLGIVTSLDLLRAFGQ
jgi:CBS domain-containing protein